MSEAREREEESSAAPHAREEEEEDDSGPLEEEEEEEEEEDQETEELMNILEGVDADLLLRALVKRNVLVQDMLMQNDIAIDDDVLRATTPTGYTALHLAAAQGLSAFAEFLLKQSSHLDDPDAHGNTALHWAVTHSDNWALVDALLLRGASVDPINHQERTPFHLACILGRVGCVRSLLLQGARAEAQDSQGLHGLTLSLLNKQEGLLPVLLTALSDEPEAEGESGPASLSSLLRAVDHHGRSALHALAATGASGGHEQEWVEVFVQRGADVNARDARGLTPIHWALAGGHQSIFQTLCQHGADLTLHDGCQRSVFHYAAYFGLAPLLADLAQHAPTLDINAPDQDGCTPLHAAAGRGTPVQALIQLGADPWARDHAQLTPLHYALMQGNQQNLLAMLGDGPGESLPTPAQLGLLDGAGRTLLHYCAAQNWEALFFRLREAGLQENKKDRHGHTLIHYAASFGSLGLIESLFASLHKHRQSSFLTSGNCASQKPLHLAAAHGNAPTCRFFLEHRASSWAPDRYGCTALHYAARYGNLEVLDVLVHGKDIHKTDKAGATALHYAALSGDTGVVDVLLAAGAKLRAKDSQGRTALFYAYDEGMMLYFQQLGLDRQAVDKQNRTLLFTVIQLHRRELFRALHLSYKMDLAERDKHKATLLHHAAYCGDLWFVQYLLEHTKLTPSTVDGRGRTVLYYAATAGRSEVVRVLLARIQKAEVREKLVDLRDRQGRSAVDAAAFGKHVESVVELTAHMHPHKHYSPAGDGRTPLHVAVNNPLDSPSLALWEALLPFYDINAQDRRGRTCLHRAVFQRLPCTTRLLLEKGADVNVGDRKGLTALMIATYHDSADILLLLQAAHPPPDVSLRDRKGRTAEDYEAKRKREEERAQAYGEDEDDDDCEPTTPR